MKGKDWFTVTFMPIIDSGSPDNYEVVYLNDGLSPTIYVGFRDADNNWLVMNEQTGDPVEVHNLRFWAYIPEFIDSDRA